MRLKYAPSIMIYLSVSMGLSGCVGGVEDPNLAPYENNDTSIRIIKMEPEREARNVSPTLSARFTLSDYIDRKSSLAGNIQLFVGENLVPLVGSLDVKEVSHPEDSSRKTHQIIVKPPHSIWMPGQKVSIVFREAPTPGSPQDAQLTGIHKFKEPYVGLTHHWTQFAVSSSMQNRRGRFVEVLQTNFGGLKISPGFDGADLFNYARQAIVPTSRATLQFQLSEPVVHPAHELDPYNIPAEIPPTPVCLTLSTPNCYHGLSVGSIDARNITPEFYEALEETIANAGSNPLAVPNFLRDRTFNPIPGTLHSVVGSGRTRLEFNPAQGASYPDTDISNPDPAGALRIVFAVLHGWVGKESYAGISPKPLYSGWETPNTQSGPDEPDFVPVTGVVPLVFVHFAGYQLMDGFGDIGSILRGGGSGALTR